MFGSQNTAPLLPPENTGILPGVLPSPNRGNKKARLPTDNIGYLPGNSQHPSEKFDENPSFGKKTSLKGAPLLPGQRKTSSSSPSGRKQSSLLGAPSLVSSSSGVFQKNSSNTSNKLSSLKGAPSLKESRGLW